VIPPTSFVFDRQRIVVAGEDSAALTAAIATLRRDGHCVTQAGDARAEPWDLALRECHLLIMASSIDAEQRTDLLAELGERMPALAVLCLADAAWRVAGEEGRPGPLVSILREPFTAEELRAAVRPLLPQLSTGSILAARIIPDHAL
jgi:DNA-binding NtrC family response regulator